jgi:hypothetical protein
MLNKYKDDKGIYDTDQGGYFKNPAAVKHNDTISGNNAIKVH